MDEYRSPTPAPTRLLTVPDLDSSWTELEENGRRAGLKLCEILNRAQAVEERQRRLYADCDRCGGDRSRNDRAGCAAHPCADGRGVHARIVVRSMLDLMRERAAGGRPQHEEDDHRERTGNRSEQRSNHRSALPRDLVRIITGPAGRCQIIPQCAPGLPWPVPVH